MKLDEWRYSARLAWQDVFLKGVILLSAIGIVVMTVFVLWKLIPEGLRSSVLTLHYTIYLGIDDVRPWPWILLHPAGIAGLFVLNTACAFGVFRSDPLAARTLGALTLLVTILWIIAHVFLLSVNL